MGIIKNVGNGVWESMKLDPKDVGNKTTIQSAYNPSDEEKETRSMIIRHLTLGYQTMTKPRREFNDMSVLGRMSVDQMAFNTYQPNNGEAYEGDVINGWKSNAIRPIVRNKCVSIAAHATARLIFPKVFARNEDSDTQEEAAKVMRYLMEYSGENSNYAYSSLTATIAAIVNPAAIVYTEYGEVYRNVKKEKGEDGKWKVEKMLDEDLSGFHDVVVPVDEFYIENIYEHDVQKQGWLIWRKVISYSTAQTKYKDYDNFKYVKPGVQVLFNDANQAFYETYDTNMRTEEVEEIVYWNKNLDVKLIVLNGVLITDYDNPNPRNDKQYPFVVFGYELIDEGKFFYYKSLAFKMQSDANIINTLYPMIIDGTYLSVFPAMVNTGSESIGSDVIVPGAVTNLTDPDSKLTPIQVSQNLQTGMNTLMAVDESLNESSQDPIQQGVQAGGAQTAYEISRLEQNAATVLGLFIKMISKYVKGYGQLRLNDILQYLTIVDVDKITDSPELVYKTFLSESKGKYGSVKIKFDGSMPDEISEKDYLDESYDILAEQDRTNQEIYKVNPRVFRDLKYSLIISPDVIQPKSEDLERAMKLELYDRAIQLGPAVDQEKVIKDFLFGAYANVKDPDEYLADMQAQQMMQQPMMMDANGMPIQDAQTSPLEAMKSHQSLPQIPSTGTLAR